jgi:hypothetical protein
MSKTSIIVSLVLLSTVSIIGRLIYHLPNVTPVAALALCITAYIGLRYSVFAVVAVMLVSDAVIGFYSTPVMIAVYSSFIASALLGTFLRKNKNIISIFTVTLSSALLFFVVTNYAVWQFGTMYEHSVSGLIQAYVMALPFFRNSLFGDLIYTSMFFGIFALVQKGYLVTFYQKAQKVLKLLHDIFARIKA